MKRIILVLFVLWCGIANAGTYREQRNLVRTLINEDTTETTPYVNNDEIYSMIDDAVAILEGVGLCNEAETTYTMVLGTFQYPLPSDYFVSEGALGYIDVSPTTENWFFPRPLKLVSMKDLGPQDPPAKSARVEFYSPHGDSVYFGPYPGGNLKVKLRYYAVSDTAVDSSTTIPVPRAYEAIIPFFTSSQVAYKMRDDRADAQMNLFINLLQILNQNMNLNSATQIRTPTTDGPVTVNVPEQ